MFCSYKGFGYIFNTIYTTVIRESFPVWQFFSGIISCMTVSFCRKNPGCRILCLWRISLNNIGLSCSQDSGSYLLPCFSFSDKSIHFFLHSWKKSPYILLNCSENSNNFKFFINYGLTFYRDMIFLWIIYQNSSLFSLIIYHIRYWRLKSVKL